MHDSRREKREGKQRGKGINENINGNNKEHIPLENITQSHPQVSHTKRSNNEVIIPRINENINAGNLQDGVVILQRGMTLETHIDNNATSLEENGSTGRVVDKAPETGPIVAHNARPPDLVGVPPCY